MSSVSREGKSRFSTRKWTLREDNNRHFHGVVDLTESPLNLVLSWRKTAADPVHLVGTFRLDLHELLQGGFIRHEPVGSAGPKVRLRIVREPAGQFVVCANDRGPRFRLTDPGA